MHSVAAAKDAAVILFHLIYHLVIVIHSVIDLWTSVRTRIGMMMRSLRRVLRSGFGVRGLSDNVTYSGGQATTGQGGFYGSGDLIGLIALLIEAGGARVASSSPSHNPSAIARQADINALSSIMVLCLPSDVCSTV